NPIWHYYKSRFQINNQNEKEAFLSINKAIELSDKKSFYIAERGNLYRAFKKYDLAKKDFNEAMKLDSNLASTYHYQILLFKEKTQIQEAIKFGEQTRAKFKNDTIANYLLGEIYLEQKNYLKSLKYFNIALSIMEYDSSYQTEDQEIKKVYLSNTYQKVGEVYQLLGDKELPKEYYIKALEALKDEIRPDKVLKEKELQGLIKL
ncbi:MAG: tetratricopeptide repeat protein, partial [Bacteroidota bacterium]